MSDASSHSDSHSHAQGGEHAADEPLWQRLLYMLGFWLFAYIAFWLSIFLAAVQFVVVLINGDKNEELRRFSRNLVQYLFECLAYLVFAREEKPFPFGRFPSVTERED